VQGQTDRIKGSVDSREACTSIYMPVCAQKDGSPTFRDEDGTNCLTASEWKTHCQDRCGGVDQIDDPWFEKELGLCRCKPDPFNTCDGMCAAAENDRHKLELDSVTGKLVYVSSGLEPAPDISGSAPVVGEARAYEIDPSVEKRLRAFYTKLTAGAVEVDSGLPSASSSGDCTDHSTCASAIASKGCDDTLVAQQCTLQCGLCTEITADTLVMPTRRRRRRSSEDSNATQSNADDASGSFDFETAGISLQMFQVGLNIGGGKGFAGIYGGDIPAFTPEGAERRRRQRREGSSETEIIVQNPSVCFQLNTMMVVKVTPESYPQYKKNALQNSKPLEGQPNFDEGPFTQLKDDVYAEGYEYFSYTFDAPGTWILSDSLTSIETIFKVMEAGVECKETFAIQTATALLTSSIEQEDDIVQQMNWVLLGSLFGACMSILILILVGVAKLGAVKWQFANDETHSYAARNALIDVGKYSSKKSAGGAPEPDDTDDRIDALITAIDEMDGEVNLKSNRLVVKGKVTDANFWNDPDQKKEEDFSVQKLNAELERTNREVISKFEDESGAMSGNTDHISMEHGAVKQLWLAKTDPSSQSNFEADGTIGSYEGKMREIGEEQERRREIGRAMNVMLAQLLKEHRVDLSARDLHQVKQHALVSEFSQRLNVLVGLHEDAVKAGKVGNPKQFDVSTMVRDQLQPLDSASIKYVASFTSESRRAGIPYAILPNNETDFGADLIDQSAQGELKRLNLNGFKDSTGCISATNGVIEFDSATKLLHPSDGTKLIYPNGDVIDATRGHCIHPETGKIYLVDGNVAYCKQAGKLVVNVGSMDLPPRQLVRYIPYPTGEFAAQLKVKPLKQGQEFVIGTLFREATHRFEVPILACTTDMAGTILPVGGVYTDPVTGMLAPITINAPVEVDGKLQLIVGVRFDERTGVVVPVSARPVEAATRSSKKQKSAAAEPFFIGSVITHPRTGEMTRVTGMGMVMDDEMDQLQPVPFFGGAASLARHIELSREAEVGRLMQELMSRARAGVDQSTAGAFFKWVAQQRAKLVAADANWESQCNANHAIGANRDLDLCAGQEKWTEVSGSGNVLGTMMYGLTGSMLPLLPGQLLHHTPSGLNVPILGVGRDPWTESVVPLAGIMADLESGTGDIPIEIGKYFLNDGRRAHTAGANRGAAGEIVPTLTPNQRFPPLMDVTTKSLDQFGNKAALRQGHIRRHGVAALGLVKSVESMNVFMLRSDFEDPNEMNTAISTLCERAKYAETQFKRQCCVGDSNLIGSVFTTIGRPGPYENPPVDGFMELLWKPGTDSIPRFVCERLTTFESRAAISLAWIAEIQSAIRDKMQDLADNLIELKTSYLERAEKMTLNQTPLRDRFQAKAQYHATIFSMRTDTEQKCRSFMQKIDLEYQHLKNIWVVEYADTEACAQLMGLVLRTAKMQESEESVMQTALERLISQLASGSMTVPAALLSIGDLIKHRDNEDALIADEGRDSPTSPEPSELPTETEGQAAEVVVDAKKAAELKVEHDRLTEAAAKLETKMAKSEDAYNEQIKSNADNLLSMIGGDKSEAEVAAAMEAFAKSAQEAHNAKETDHSAAVNGDADYMNAFLSDDFLSNMVDFEPTVDADAQLESTFSQISSQDDLMFAFSDDFMIDFEPSMDGGAQLSGKFNRTENTGGYESLDAAAQMLINQKVTLVTNGLNEIAMQLISGCPDAILNAASAADRRLRLKAARARLERNMILNAKIKNTLAARMKALEFKFKDVESQDLSNEKRKQELAVQAAEMEKLLVELEKDVYDPNAIFTAEEAAERRRRIKAARARMAADQILDAKLRNRLAAKLKALASEETCILQETEPEAVAGGLSIKDDVDVATIAAEEKLKAKAKLAAIRKNVANMQNLMLKGLSKKDIPPAIKMALMALEDQADQLEKQIVEDSAANVLKQVANGDSDAIDSFSNGVSSCSANGPSRLEQAAVVSSVERGNALEAGKNQQIEKSVENSGMSLKEKAAMLKAAGISLEKREQKFVEKQIQMKLAHEAKLKDLEAKAAAELKAQEDLEMSKLDGIFLAEKDFVVSDSTAEFEQVMAEQAANMNAQDAEELMAEHKAGLAGREARIAEEKQKQKALIKARLDKAKHAKQDRIKRLMGLETMQLDHDAAGSAAAQATRNQRTEAMANLKDTSQKSILETLQSTHKQEVADIIEQHSRSAEVRIAKVVLLATEVRSAERDALEVEHSKEMVRYVNQNADSEDKKQFEAGRAELAAAHAASLERFDAGTEAAEYQVRHKAEQGEALVLSARQLEVRETQCREIADTLTRLHPSASLAREYEAQAEAAAKEAAGKRRDIAGHNNQAIVQKKQAMKDAAAAEALTRLEALNAQISAMSAEVEVEKEKTKQMVAAKVAERSEQIEQERQEIAADLYEQQLVKKLAVDEGEELLKEFSENAADAVKVFAGQRTKQKDAIAKRLAARRAAKAAKKAEERELNPSPEPEEEVESFPSNSSTGSAFEDVDEAFAGDVSFGVGENVLAKLADIEALMAKRNGVAFKGVPYVNPEDTSWANGAVSLKAALVVKEALAANEIIALEFGVQQSQQLANHWGFAAIEVHIVNDLPESTASGHAFPTSYSYDPDAHAVYIRRARLENVGMFLMVILHILAHVKVDSMVDDTNPAFVAAFYDGLQVACAKLIESRSKTQKPVWEEMPSGASIAVREAKVAELVNLNV
jgi:hypothetical protein